MSNVYHSKGREHFSSEREGHVLKPWDRQYHDSFSDLKEAQCVGVQGTSRRQPTKEKDRLYISLGFNPGSHKALNCPSPLMWDNSSFFF